MAQYQRKSRKGQEELEEEESRHKKKAPQPVYDQLKATDEGVVPVADFLAEPSADKHAALLADVPSDEQRANLVTQLQQSYGNTYVQRVVEHIQSEKGSGQPLEPKTRSEMEAAFNQDFGNVRIHTDTTADKLARELDAKAVTSGEDIFFREGDYHPGSEAGKGLLGHELAHVIQQDSGTIDTQHALSDSRSSLETAADAAGKAIVSGQSVSLGPTASVSPVQFQKVGPEKEEGPPKTTKDPVEILGKVLEAAKKTKEGKMIGAKLKEALTTEEGMITLSMLAVPALAVGFAENMEVPQGLVDLVPKILKFEVGKDMEIALQPIYKGKLGEKPREWGGMLTFTIKDW